MIKYSVIVPFHSNSNLLTMCISALEKALDMSESEIIVVDNNAAGSQIDSSLQIGERCRLFSIKDNLMYSRAINFGVEKARGKYLLFCDADTCVTPGFQRALVDNLNSHNIGYTSAMLLNMDTNRIQEFGITSSYYNFPHPYAGRPMDYELVTENHSPLAGCAACSAIKRDLFMQVGGFDEKLIHSYSDIDLCLRLEKIGYKTMCVANAIAYHCGSSTKGSGMGPSLKEDTKGIFTAKHPEIPVQITQYIDKSCDFILSKDVIKDRDFYVLICSTVANPELYVNRIINNLNIAETGRFKHPYSRRDAICVDYINFIPYFIREYRIPILYFVDSFLSFRGNTLWKSCRKEYSDIVADRNANVEFLSNIL